MFCGLFEKSPTTMSPYSHSKNFRRSAIFPATIQGGFQQLQLIRKGSDITRAQCRLQARLRAPRQSRFFQLVVHQHAEMLQTATSAWCSTLDRASMSIKRLRSLSISEIDHRLSLSGDRNGSVESWLRSNRLNKLTEAANSLGKWPERDRFLSKQRAAIMGHGWELFLLAQSIIWAS